MDMGSINRCSLKTIGTMLVKHGTQEHDYLLESHRLNLPAYIETRDTMCLVRVTDYDVQRDGTTEFSVAG